MSSKMTNEEFFSRLMTYGPYGAMQQVMIIEAIRYYTELVSKQPRPSLPGEELISAQTWWDTANYIQKQLVENYDG